MPRSGQTCSSERSLRRDEAAVSEVIGYSLSFGILSTILVLALVGFNDAQEDVEARVVALRAASAAQRVAGAVVEAGLLVEQQDADRYNRTIVLPEHFEGHGYTVTLDGAQAAVRVEVPSLDLEQTEPLLGAGLSIAVCDPPQPVPGGPIRLVYGTTTLTDGCLELHLEEVQ